MRGNVFRLGNGSPVDESVREPSAHSYSFVLDARPAKVLSAARPPRWYSGSHQLESRPIGSIDLGESNLMKRLHLASWVGLIQLTFACASGSLPDVAKFDVGGMLAREAEPLEIQQLRSTDGAVRASVPAHLASDVVFADGVYTIELGIGGEGNINCWVYPEGLHLATSISALSDVILGNEALLGEIEAKQIELTTAGAIDRYAYLGSASWSASGPRRPRPSRCNPG